MSNLLDTNNSNPEIEQAAVEPHFYMDVEQTKLENPEPLKVAVSKAKEFINPFVISLIDRCAIFESQTELNEEKKMELYDAKTAVRHCVEEIVDKLQEELPKGPVKIGTTWYFVIKDTHVKTGNNNWLIMLEDKENISFREPRGLSGDNDFKFAQHEQNVHLIEDVIIASQAV